MLKAKKMKGAVTKDSKEDGGLKLKDGLITEEISEETSDDTVSANNSWTRSDTSERHPVLNETSIQNLFTNVDREKTADKTGDDEGTPEGGKESVQTADQIDLVSTDCDQIKEVKDGDQLETQKKNYDDNPHSKVKTKCSFVKDKGDESNSLNEVDALDETLINESSMVDSIASSDGSSELPLCVNPDQSVDINDILATKGLSVESSVSSVYLTAEESDDCKPDCDDIGAIVTAEKQEVIAVTDNLDPLLCLSAVGNVDNVDVSDMTISDCDSKDFKKDKTDCAVQTDDANKDFGLPIEIKSNISNVQIKTINELPDSMNVECAVSTDVKEKEGTVVNELKDEIEHENLEMKHDLLFPVVSNISGETVLQKIAFSPEID